MPLELIQDHIKRPPDSLKSKIFRHLEYFNCVQYKLSREISPRLSIHFD